MSSHSVSVWDLPTRLFHWTLVVLFVALIVTGQVGADWIEWHFYLGYVLSGLVVFRILWGLVGSYYARFVSFLPCPKRMYRYLKSFKEGHPEHHYGHNPMGALMVFALLIGLGLQLASGMSISDDIMWDGPFYAVASDGWAELAGSLHHLLPNILIGLVVLHILAVVVHKVFLKDALVPAMVHGKKEKVAGVEAKPVKVNYLLLGLSILLAGGWLYYLFSIPV